MKKFRNFLGVPALLAAGALAVSFAHAQQQEDPFGEQQRDQQRQQQEVQIGQQVPAEQLELQDLDGQQHNLQEYIDDQKIIVLEWIDPESPYVRMYHTDHDIMQQTFERFEGEDVEWFAVISTDVAKQNGMQQQQRDPFGEQQQQQQQPGEGEQQQQQQPGEEGLEDQQQQQPGQEGIEDEQPGVEQEDEGRLRGRDEFEHTDRLRGRDPVRDNGQQQPMEGELDQQTREQLNQQLEEFDLQYPVLIDEGGKLAQQFGVKRVPHVLIIDREGNLAYSGAIDNARTLHQPGTVNYVAMALEQLTADERVSIPQTPSFGTPLEETTLPAGAPRNGMEERPMQEDLYEDDLQDDQFEDDWYDDELDEDPWGEQEQELEQEQGQQ